MIALSAVKVVLKWEGCLFFYLMKKKLFLFKLINFLRICYSAALVMYSLKTIRYMVLMPAFGPKYQIIIEMVNRLKSLLFRK